MTSIKILLVLLLIIIVAGLLFMYSGAYNVAATKPHGAITKWILETTQERSVEARARDLVAPPSLMLEERRLRGAQSYGAMCQMCHLGPGVKPTPLHEGLMPGPPELTEVASRHSPGYLFWAIKYGIRMTGMPAWGTTHSDESLWDIVAFIEQLPQMTPEEYEQLTSSNDEHVH